MKSFSTWFFETDPVSLQTLAGVLTHPPSPPGAKGGFSMRPLHQLSTLALRCLIHRGFVSLNAAHMSPDERPHRRGKKLLIWKSFFFFFYSICIFPLKEASQKLFSGSRFAYKNLPDHRSVSVYYCVS